MDSSILFNRYVWLVDIIARNGRITYDKIDRMWQGASINPGGEGLPKKTFQNHCEKIKELFNIRIACDRKGNYEYYIVDYEALMEKGGGIMAWILNSFAISNVLNENTNLTSRILFEAMPIGHRLVPELLECMASSTLIQLDYKSYLSESVSRYDVEPYCLKIFKRRWYLLGRNALTGRVNIYSLDRIENINRTGVIFHLPVDFNSRQFFSRYYGALVGDQKHVETILLKVSSGQQEYFRTVPWHHSQLEIESTEDYSVFQYKMCVTMDFVQDLLSQSYSVEVLAPKSLRETVKFLLKKMSAVYGL